jgi:hypothetical protein
MSRRYTRIFWIARADEQSRFVAYYQVSIERHPPFASMPILATELDRRASTLPGIDESREGPCLAPSSNDGRADVVAAGSNSHDVTHWPLPKETRDASRLSVPSEGATESNAPAQQLRRTGGVNRACGSGHPPSGKVASHQTSR